MTTNPRTIITEVGQWAKEQPWGESSGNPRHAPDYGVVEEFGELMHCILKRQQRIRGMDDPETFAKKAKDAFGDMMVYLSHWCYLEGAYFTLKPVENTGSEILRPYLTQILICITQLVSKSHTTTFNTPEESTQIATNLAHFLNLLAAVLGFNLLEAYAETWDRVKKRNWNKDAMCGGETGPSSQEEARQ